MGARGSSHSHGRTTQGHQSKVSPCPLTQHGTARHGTAQGSTARVDQPPKFTHTKTPKHRGRPGSRARRPSLHPVGEIKSGDGGKSQQLEEQEEMGRKQDKEIEWVGEKSG